jgi:hypothetical protein
MKKGFGLVAILILSLVFVAIMATSAMADQEELLGSMNIYYGSLHAHSNFSDGKGTPEENFLWARDIAKYDFYALTDHSEQVFPWMWSTIKNTANKYNVVGQFCAMRGFEWGNPLSGHINVLDSDTQTNVLVIQSVDLFYLWLQLSNGIGQYNHPGSQPLNYNNFRYISKADKYMCLLETGNGGTGNNDNQYVLQYIKALDKGWHVAPADNQDNHSMSTNCHRTAIVASELSRTSLKDAIRNRRVYSTDDPNMKVVFKAGPLWMGSQMATSDPEITFTVSVTDDEPIMKMELISNKGVVLATKTFSESADEYSWQPTVPIAADAYYFVKVYELNTIETSDGGIQIAVTAPIWVDFAN